MTTEQKAKAYDEALDKFRPIYELAKQQGRNIDVEEFEDIFPELKESEDESAEYLHKDTLLKKIREKIKETEESLDWRFDGLFGRLSAYKDIMDMIYKL